MKRLTIIGNAGCDAELRFDGKGQAYAVFPVAVDRNTKGNSKADWIDVNCNGKLAEIASNYVKKGTKVLIEGYPTVNVYTNKENITVGALRVYANILELFGSNEVMLKGSKTCSQANNLMHKAKPAALDATEVPF